MISSIEKTVPGTDGLSVAFDLPTLDRLDSDPIVLVSRAMAVHRVGVIRSTIAATGARCVDTFARP